MLKFGEGSVSPRLESDSSGPYTHRRVHQRTTRAERERRAIDKAPFLTRDAPTTGIADLDRQLASRGDGLAMLDLRDVDYLSHDTLLYIVAAFHERARKGLDTRLTLPRRETAADFLRAWGLPAALEAATDDRFEFLLEEESRDRFAKLSPTSRYERVIFRPGGGRETLLPKSFFAITPLSIPLQSVWAAVRTSPRRTAALERDRWLEAHILSVLDLYLSDRGDEVASRVVYEAVLNAAHHPKASLGMVSSQLVRSRADGRFGEPEAIEIAIWDNGDSFAKTLAARVTAGLPIQSEAFGKVDETFDVEVHGVGGQASSRLTLGSSHPLAVGSDAALTVAAFMLGVTSSPERGKYVDDEMFQTQADPAGSGLYYIRRTVVDKFGGTIRYLAGHSRMELRAGAQRGRYLAVLRNSKQDFANVAGNLLIVRIPVQNPYSGPRNAARTAALAR